VRPAHPERAERRAAPRLDPADPAAELPALVRLAAAARAAAYAPYSDYPVGAAVLCADGRVFTGCNVENAAFGATVCAERVAVWTAVAAGARRIAAVAVVTASAGTPCGDCRQVLAEFGAAELVIGVAMPGGAISAYTLGELLPHAWTRRDLDAAAHEPAG
jgi:cytidine deaminase